MQWKKIFERLTPAFWLQSNSQEPDLAFSETEFVRHPTLGVGQPLPDIQNEDRQVINTSKIEVDRLSRNTFVNQYLIIKDLGDGSFGKVKLVLNMEDNCLYALKAVSKHQTRREMFRGKALESENTSNVLLREINVMRSLQHPNVVQLYEVIDDPSSDKLVMILEYEDGGEVLRSDMLGPSKSGFSEEVARKHFRDLVKGLQYLHHRNIIHRDIKPGNLLLTLDGRVKLSDFGSAFYFPDGNDLVVDSAGTRLFFAPESCGQGIPYHGKKADVYAAGVVLYMLVFAKAPFESDNDCELLRKIREEEPDFTSRTDLSQELLDLLKKLLCKDPDTRPSVDQVSNHPWVTDGPRVIQMRPSRDLAFPKGPESRVSSKSDITPSITRIVDQIPNKQTWRFKEGEYLVKEGQVLNGWYLIRKGYCEATSTEWDYEQEIELADGDSDFQEDDEEDLSSSELTQPASPYLSGSSQEFMILLGSQKGELERFQSLPKDEVLKGIGRRCTQMHCQIEHVVETAFEDYCKTARTSLERSRNGRLRGPGAIVGLDLDISAVESRRTVIALGDVETIFVQKEAVAEMLTRPENHLPVRLYRAQLQRIEMMRNVVERLAGLHSDVVLLGKLRSTRRKQT